MQDKDEPPNWLKPIHTWHEITDRTLESLGIDVDGAKIDPARLLPSEIRPTGAKEYPLPRDKSDILAICGLGWPYNVDTAYGNYVRRCRYRLANWDVTKKVRVVKYDRSALVLKEVRAIAKARKQADEELAKVQQAVAVVRTTMLETSQEFDTGFGMIARAFNRNEILPNGETVTVKALISAYKNFYDHMHKLGGPITDDMAEEAEEAVFAKAMEASRERIQRTLRTAIPIHAETVHAAVAAEVKPVDLKSASRVGGVVGAEVEVAV